MVSPYDLFIGFHTVGHGNLIMNPNFLNCITDSEGINGIRCKKKNTTLIFSTKLASIMLDVILLLTNVVPLYNFEADSMLYQYNFTFIFKFSNYNQILFSQIRV